MGEVDETKKKKKVSAAKEIREEIFEYLKEHKKTNFATLQKHLDANTGHTPGSIIGALRTVADLDNRIIKFKEGSKAYYDLTENHKNTFNDGTSNVLSLHSFEKEVIDLLTKFNGIKMELLNGLEVDDYSYWQELKGKLEDLEEVVLNHKNQRKEG